MTKSKVSQNKKRKSSSPAAAVSRFSKAQKQAKCRSSDESSLKRTKRSENYLLQKVVDEVLELAATTSSSTYGAGMNEHYDTILDIYTPICPWITRAILKQRVTYRLAKIERTQTEISDDSWSASSSSTSSSSQRPSPKTSESESLRNEWKKKLDESERNCSEAKHQSQEANAQLKIESKRTKEAIQKSDALILKMELMTSQMESLKGARESELHLLSKVQAVDHDHDQDHDIWTIDDLKKILSSLSTRLESLKGRIQPTQKPSKNQRNLELIHMLNANGVDVPRDHLLEAIADTNTELQVLENIDLSETEVDVDVEATETLQGGRSDNNAETEVHTRVGAVTAEDRQSDNNGQIRIKVE